MAGIFAFAQLIVDWNRRLRKEVRLHMAKACETSRKKSILFVTSHHRLSLNLECKFGTGIKPDAPAQS